MSGALASGKRHRAPGKRPAPPGSASLSASELFVSESLDLQDALTAVLQLAGSSPAPPNAYATPAAPTPSAPAPKRPPAKRSAPPGSASLSASAEKLFMSESLDTQNTLENNVTAEEVIEMIVLLVWPSAVPRACAETEGLTQVHLAATQSAYHTSTTYVYQKTEQELGRFPTAEALAAPQLQAPQLQLTSAAMLAPPAPTAAPPPVGPVRWTTRVLPIGIPVGIPMPLPGRRVHLPPKLPRLRPQGLSYPTAPPSATAAPSRAPELLTAAAALRSFVEQYLESISVLRAAPAPA